MRLKRFIKPSLFLGFFLVFICLNSYATVILIDPGHGGEEQGAIGYVQKVNSKGVKYQHKIYEKDIALDIAKEIHKQLKAKSFSTYLTRSFDRTVSLEDRAQIAQKVQADLYISIHLNHFKNSKVNGFETYYLDNHKDAAVKKVENIENKSLKGEDLVINQILIDLVVQKTVRTSRALAGEIHDSLGKNLIKKFKVKDRKVRPGLFYVLALSKRPAVLLEAGFMSNPREMKKLLSKKYQKAYAMAVVKAIEEFVKTNKPATVPIF